MPLQQQQIGFGTAPLGNLFRDIPEEEVQATLASVWHEGIRYFDTAPLYGAGLSELRLGKFLQDKNRDDYVLSTKVGRLVSEETETKEGLFAMGRQNKLIEDYTEDGTLRSIEQSLERLQTDRLDVVYVHDISPDFHGDDWLSLFEESRNGAFKALQRLQNEGVIQAWGVGVNTTVPIELALELEETTPSLSLQATHYTLLKHERSLQRLMPLVERENSGIVVGAPYNSGVLLGGDYDDYVEAGSEVQAHVRRLEELTSKHNVSLKAAALQFSSAHPSVQAVIPGSTRPDRIREDVAAMKEEIPAAFWQELKREGLIAAEAPVPTD
ncbi:D-threo-aldose 1-dehydrogenase [Salsuginibacillus halophilus]|uniref:D-threo-aldose 1-dehydrogenase n=1 Tax=Salsuginibacillus halophilus TaxID=517424 RepID=A0A2P8H9M0_9BACI|nr:D-threo-aldose 1-dehydrogenase [Salsuginibacillus halophilus]